MNLPSCFESAGIAVTSDVFSYIVRVDEDLFVLTTAVEIWPGLRAEQPSPVERPVHAADIGIIQWQEGGAANGGR
jgi:hypothetical protein